MQFLRTIFSQPNHQPVFTDEELNALRERNEQRLIQAKNELGTKYLLHPSNKIPRKTKVAS